MSKSNLNNISCLTKYDLNTIILMRNERSKRMR